jgi:cytochrome c2
MRTVMFFFLSTLLAVFVIPLHTNAMSEKEASTAKAETGIIVKTDDESIGKGKEIFDLKCYFCHDANSTKKSVGPGLKGILKLEKFPVSEIPATPENIARQLRTPYNAMPSFSYLTEDDILNIIAYLNTL